MIFLSLNRRILSPSRWVGSVIQFDPRTLLASLFLTYLMATLCLLFVRMFQKTYLGFGQWIVAMGALAKDLLLHSDGSVSRVSRFTGAFVLMMNQQRMEAELVLSLKRVRVLQGLLPICSSCRRIRGKDGAWTPLEPYIRDHSEADLTHGLCPTCADRLYPELAEDGAGGF